MNPKPATARHPVDPASDDPSAIDLSLPDSQSLVRHPDGYYWLGVDGRAEFGPFATAEEALAEMHRNDDGDIEPDESLPEAEMALGLSDWLDPDTGGLAEATHVRIEDH